MESDAASKKFWKREAKRERGSMREKEQIIWQLPVGFAEE